MKNILFVDIQAVGTPGKGFPLEVAWKTQESAVRTCFFRNENREIPPRISRLTGIEQSELTGEEALPSHEIAELFLKAAGIPDAPLLLAAHHAVYEKRWLDHITGLDLSFICTREMAVESLPGLKSGSLRAVAGIIGHVMGSFRRASTHVLATERIYEALVKGFTHEPVSREERLALPGVPGVYHFLDPGGNVLYTGKAKNLRNRVNGHFTGRASGRRGEMLSRISSIEYEETETPLHAAVLESKLISELSPEYNRAGKILASRVWYLSRDMTSVMEGTGEKGSFGPFISRGPLDDFSLLICAMASAENKKTFVENLFAEVPPELFNPALEQLRKTILDRGILNYGMELHRQAGTAAEEDVKTHEEVIDEAFVQRKLNGMIHYGTLLCRRSAAVKLLSGSRIKWLDESDPETVHNFVENSASEEFDQERVRKLAVLLCELRRIYKAGRNPELVTSSGCVLRGERLKAFLDSV